MDTNDNVLFTHMFNTRLAAWWYSDLNSIKPEETYNEQPFSHYKNETQSICHQASRLITFKSFTSVFDKQGVTIPTDPAVDDLADPFRVLGDANDTIDSLCA